MCITTDTVSDICRHTTTITNPCFAARHPSIPFTRCRPSTVLKIPATLCDSCLAVFAEGDIDGHSANRLVSQWRHRENFSGILIPRLSEQGIRMMDRYGAVFGRFIPRGAWWSETAEDTELESARGRSRRLQLERGEAEGFMRTMRPRPLRGQQQQRAEPEGLMQPVRHRSPRSPRYPQSPRQTGTGGYRQLNRNSSLF